MSKKTMSRQGKKKMTRNILIGVAIALVIAVAIFLIVALQPDSAGMNCFQRKATVASADGEKITMGEYRVAFDSQAQLYKYYGITMNDSILTQTQEYSARQTLMQKIYIKEAQAQGLTLTKDEIAECKKTAEEYVATMENQIKNQMVGQGTYSKTQYDKQIAQYYKALGMNRNEYLAFIQQGEEANKYASKMSERFETENTPDEETLAKYYRDAVEAAMYSEKEDGTKELQYTDGQFWENLEKFSKNTGDPMKYLPEGFIFIELVELEAATAEEADKIVGDVENGAFKFEEMKSSKDNKDPFAGKVNGPYPIAEKDHTQLFESDDVYTKAAELEIGMTGAVKVENKAEDDTVTYTVYVIRRVDGDSVFMDKEARIIKIDYFTDLSETYKTNYISEKWNELQNSWLSDIKYEDAIYKYNGGIS